ncbi:MAG TPA: sigma factor-like helix-turn-helix DNA-binding protein [Bryobacteraceae bacterium]|nr:sigma factor-like helix-turn-helix DNA-binding protein [Bryobacteraceae bacterium]
MNVSQLSLRRLRGAIQNHQISFPSQMPVFACQSRADIQWRVAELYFVHNWSCDDLGQRYGVTMERVRQLITQWARRAAVLGYLQEIPAASALLADLPAQPPARSKQRQLEVLPLLPLPYPQMHAAAHGR